MIPTSRLRLLRTSLRAHPPILSPKAFAASQRRVSPCLRVPHASPRATASFATTFPERHEHADAAEKEAKRRRSLPSLPVCPVYPVNSAAANPPATTRPPPLDLPTRRPQQSAFSFYFATGKAYLSFYKTGLKHIYTNTQLVWTLDKHTTTSHPSSSSDPSLAPAIDPNTRAAFLLRHRQRHDIRRLPPFALILLICGEFTPFIVLAFPSLVPLTCRIPRQIAALQKKSAERREVSMERLMQHTQPWLRQQSKPDHRQPRPGTDAQMSDEASARHGQRRDALITHIARAHNLISPLWDRLPPSLDSLVSMLVARRAVARYVQFVMRDDILLWQAGGMAALQGVEELELACWTRGLLDVRKDSVAEVLKQQLLRNRLVHWLETAPHTSCHGQNIGAARTEYILRLANEREDIVGVSDRSRSTKRPSPLSSRWASAACKHIWREGAASQEP